MRNSVIRCRAGQAFLAVMLLAAQCCAAAAAAVTPGSIAAYSNLCVDSESGDVLGTKIALIDLGGNDTYVFYQIAEGRELKPQIAWVSPFKFRNSQLEFEVLGIDGSGPKQTVRGTISEDAITLTSGGFNLDEDPTHPGHDSHGQVIKSFRLKRVPMPVPYENCK